jgi:hypothetical protein
VHLARRKEKEELRKLPFPMLADIKRELATLLGVLDPEAGVAQRATYIVYYRFLHLVEDAEYQTLPARLRMQIVAGHGIGRDDFELLSLAVSAVIHAVAGALEFEAAA